MNILLINPPTLFRGKNIYYITKNLTQQQIPYYKRLWVSDRDKIKGTTSFPFEHLGLQSIKSFLSKRGHNVTILNACIERHSTLLQTVDDIHINWDLIGFTGPQDVYYENLWLATEIRKKGYTKHITIGHDFATLNHQEILLQDSPFDSVIRGEGEFTLLELANALENKQSLKKIHGLTYKSNEKIHINTPRKTIFNLDELDWVDRSDLPKVLDMNFSPSIYTQRGCPYKCSFCTTGKVSRLSSSKNIWRKRSYENVVNEIQFLKEKYKIPYLSIVDDLYIGKGRAASAHSILIAEELIRRNISIKYMADTRIDCINYNIFKILKKSGLNKVFIGIENGSSNTLNIFQKGYNPSIISEKLAILDDLDIKYILGFIMFNPYETLEGLKESIKLIEKTNLNDYELFLQSVRIYSGTNLHLKLKQDNMITGEFPLYEGIYKNEKVLQIKNILTKISNESIKLLSGNTVNEIEFRYHMYQVLSKSFKKIVNDAIIGKNINITHQEIIHEIEKRK